MADIAAQDATVTDMAGLPKVLVVDHDALALERVTANADLIRQYYQVEPVVLLYPLVESSGKALQQVLAYVRDPAHGIAMVLTAHRAETRVYGSEIAKHLRYGEPAFAGPVAVLVSDLGALDQREIQHSGAIRLFNGGEPIAKNYPKADGTLERRANPHHPFALLAEAYHERRAEGGQRPALPHLLMIDADPNFCKILTHQAAQYRIEYGMKVTVVRYDPVGADGLTIEQILAYVQEHPVDMVLTGNTYKQAPYGREIASGLTHLEPRFAGIVAIQTADTPSADDRAQASAAGASHVFSKEEPPLNDGQRNELSALAALAVLYRERRKG